MTIRGTIKCYNFATEDDSWLKMNPSSLAVQQTLAVSEIPHEEELLKLLDAIRKLERHFKLGRRFNLFEALNIAKQEIRHSRFLAYLLDPQETHGLGDRFLRGLLMSAADSHPQSPVTRLALSIRDLSDATVHCERDHFDITVQLPSLGLLFVIENKIDASESSNQLMNYRKNAETRHPEYKFMGSFLTPDGYDGDDPNWGTMSYGTVVTELRSALAETTLPSEALVALNHYIDLIERKIVTSQALVDACRELYRAHKIAFDLVMEHGQESLLALAFEQFVSSRSDLEAAAKRSETIFFLDKRWKSISKAAIADRKRWPHEFPVLFWFQQSEKKLQLRLEIGPMLSDYAAVRIKLVQLFKKEYQNGRTSASPIFTRVLTVSEKLPDDPTMEDVLAAMETLWDKWKNNHGGSELVKDLLSRWAEVLQ
jgi:hypothetical protein